MVHHYIIEEKQEQDELKLQIMKNEQILDFYNTNGFYIERLFSRHEINKYREESDRLLKLRGEDTRPYAYPHEDSELFNDLWKHDRDTLDSDLLAWKEITVHPDSQHPLEVEVELKKGEGFLGVVAFFREYQGKTWRQLLPLKDAPLNPFQAQKFAIVLDHHSIQVSQPK